MRRNACAFGHIVGLVLFINICVGKKYAKKIQIDKPQILFWLWSALRPFLRNQISSPITATTSQSIVNTYKMGDGILYCEPKKKRAYDFSAICWGFQYNILPKAETQKITKLRVFFAWQQEHDPIICFAIWFLPRRLQDRNKFKNLTDLRLKY